MFSYYLRMISSVIHCANNLTANNMKTIMYLVMLIALTVLQFVKGSDETFRKEENVEWTECKAQVITPKCEIIRVQEQKHCS